MKTQSTFSIIRYAVSKAPLIDKAFSAAIFIIPFIIPTVEWYILAFPDEFVSLTFFIFFNIPMPLLANHLIELPVILPTLAFVLLSKGIFNVFCCTYISLITHAALNGNPISYKNVFRSIIGNNMLIKLAVIIVIWTAIDTILVLTSPLQIAALPCIVLSLYIAQLMYLTISCLLFEKTGFLQTIKNTFILLLRKPKSSVLLFLLYIPLLYIVFLILAAVIAFIGFGFSTTIFLLAFGPLAWLNLALWSIPSIFYTNYNQLEIK